ncbi:MULTISPECIES: sulfotransferase domain-containing protein [unclassified Synechococcus]|uniref:sulfotransferase domain-containing protein n=1 Tax=unclassified Synechococcus TaxID=2626047 RepID=UPI0039AFE733
MNQPNFFLIGAQKTGTTYLSTILLKHREVFFSNPKELFFFNKDCINQNDYRDYCDKYFLSAAKRIGEGSTTYLQSSIAPRNIKKFVPNTPLFIVCLRHPLEKAVSFFIHNWRRDRYPTDCSILSAGASNRQLSPLYSSFYADGIQNWLETYDYQRHQFLFLQQEELSANSDSFILKATEFLNISQSKYKTSNKVNRGLVPIQNDKLDSLDFQISDSTSGAVKSVSIPLRDLKELHYKLLDQKDKVEALTGLSLSHWESFPYGT